MAPEPEEHRKSLSPEPSNAAPAYSLKLLQQLCAVEAELIAKRIEVLQKRQLSEELLRRAQRIQQLQRQVDSASERVAAKKQQLQRHAHRVEEASALAEQLVLSKNERIVGQTTVTVFEKGVEALGFERAKVKLRQDRIILEDLRAMLARQRAVVAEQLLFIFPIEMDIRDSGESVWTICGLCALSPQSIHDRLGSEETAAALGLVARVLDAVARYMGVPLRFPVVPRGSRSAITNPFARASPAEPDKPVQADWPLFMLRVPDKARLHAALRLLATNIEQLLGLLGISDVDHDQLLPNLTQLLMAIEGCSFAR
ncbi:hypothetical protein GGI25_001489 [Coemansia spiralis]|uniref:Autophagy-related protein 14 n=2 Tax=Coemansia TaxID=4863 RepID=A0A9W8KZI4_9FUNG|nr:hypothetical protein BX070DRAFT_218956 [Coemansia spiralis]KAJ1994828.1 hypothetical protein EDC05_001452 [Coemansia umbellata]KAJ2624470.1 hypothetical protein GGI26_001387 [Coemansia sp. RSA 1358]KAJ2679565.1 hypothetical protein GGI25_001489 [Coemansia spiralis]